MVKRCRSRQSLGFCHGIKEKPEQNLRCGQSTFGRSGAVNTQVLYDATKNYGVEIRPLLVATTKRLPQRTIESTRPTPGTVCPGVTHQTPCGPSITAVPFTTSRSVQPSIVVGLVSGVGVSFRASFTAAPVEAVRGGATIGSLLASRGKEAVLTGFVGTAKTLAFCRASAGAFGAIWRTVISCA